MIGAKSGITKDMPPESKIAGMPSRDIGTWLRIQALLEKLPDMKNDMKSIKRKLESLEKKGLLEEID